MSIPTPLRAAALAGLLVLACEVRGQEPPPELAPSEAPAAAQTAGAVSAPGPDPAALLQAETAGRLAAAVEENDRLRGEVERLTQELAGARTRVQVLTEQRGERALITAGGIALSGVVAGMILGRIAAGRRRRGGF